MRLTRHPSEMSALSVNWQNPINWNHQLNKGVLHWWFSPPHWQGGTVSRDLLKKLNGTLTGGATWVNSPYGVAVNLDGTDGHIDPSNTTLFTGLSQWAVVALIKWNSLSTNDRIAGRWSGTGANRSWLLSTDSASELIGAHEIAGGDINVNITTGAALVTGRYYHIVWNGALIGSDYEIWIDGINQSMTGAVDNSGTPQAGSDGFFIGKDVDGNFTTADIASLTLYSRTLNPSEVGSHFQLSTTGWGNILNRWGRRAYSEQVAAAAGNPWYQYQQQMAGAA